MILNGIDAEYAPTHLINILYKESEKKKEVKPEESYMI
jgi:hypothetical protein